MANFLSWLNWGKWLSVQFCDTAPGDRDDRSQYESRFTVLNDVGYSTFIYMTKKLRSSLLFSFSCYEKNR